MVGFDFQQAVEVVLLRLGVRAGDRYEWQLETRAGPLEIQVHDTWLQTCFSDPHKAASIVRHGKVDPLTGSWDWHFERPTMDDVHAIKLALDGLLDAQQEKLSESIEQFWNRLERDFLANSRAKGIKISLKKPTDSGKLTATFPMGIPPEQASSSTTQTKGKLTIHPPGTPLPPDYPFAQPVIIFGVNCPEQPLVPKREPDLDDIAFEILRQARYKN